MRNSIVAALADRTVLIVGDVMLDRFVYGTVDRISPEAPVPVLRFRKETASLGGAGNVARNVTALNGKAVLVGATGDDPAGFHIAESLCRSAAIDARLARTGSYPTCVKTRFVGECGQQVLRVDSEEVQLDDATLHKIQSTVIDALSCADTLVLSDYAKGVLTPDSIRLCVDAAKAAGVPVVVDPKSDNLNVYGRADVITPNAREATAATGHDCSTDAGAAEAAVSILRTTQVEAVLITRGPHGMTLLAPKSGVESPRHLATDATSVYDVCGAGDTVLATMALALSAGIDIATAAQLANTAAGITVGRPGTAAVSAEELAQACAAPGEPLCATRDHAASAVRHWRRQGLRVGFANGCFDLIHPGHVALLREAREQCDRLVVALNSDASVRRLKGATRPVQDQFSRASVIAAMRSVDLVTVFDEDTPLELIRSLRPDVVIKGDDYQIHEVVGSEIVAQWGGRVHLVPIEADHSTSSIVARLERAPIE